MKIYGQKTIEVVVERYCEICGTSGDGRFKWRTVRRG